MKTRGYLIMSILWMCLIWLLSSMPSKELPRVEIIGVDKLAHFSLYCVWAVLSRLFADSFPKHKTLQSIILLFLLMMAGLDEYHQIFIPGRDVSAYDLLANWSGILFGWFLSPLFWRRRAE